MLRLRLTLSHPQGMCIYIKRVYKIYTIYSKILSPYYNKFNISTISQAFNEVGKKKFFLIILRTDYVHSVQLSTVWVWLNTGRNM